MKIFATTSKNNTPLKHSAILFDMDGVLLDSEPVHFAAFKAVLKSAGHELDEVGYLTHFAGKTDQNGLESYFRFMQEKTDPTVLLDEKAKTYLKLAADQLVAYDGVVALVHRLAEVVPLALVTGSLQSEATLALSALGIENCFREILTAEDVKEGKPSPEGYRKAAQKLHVPPEKCVVVEDSTSGVKAAKAAHMYCVAVATTHSKNELNAADTVVERLSWEVFKGLIQ